MAKKQASVPLSPPDTAASLDLAIYGEEIKKTGFVLENEIANTLKKGGWTVISNKYYVDDSEQTVREIDLLAYRTTVVDGLTVYTVLIISCKKSEESAWALLARGVNLRDPNADWWPLHIWSNDKVMQFQFNQPGHAKAFHDAAINAAVANAMSLPEVEVFAFQEMDRQSGRPKNDRAIFQSVSSLMKAQAYEVAVLPDRKKKPLCVYQFNLLNVVDAPLLRLMFDGTKIDCSYHESEHYFARHIIGKRETFSRIRFVRAAAFEGTLEEYAALHKANCAWVAAKRTDYFADVLKDWRKAAVLERDFISKIAFTAGISLRRAELKAGEMTEVVFSFDKDSGKLQIGLFLSDAQVGHLNADKTVMKLTAEALKSVYRYTQPFEFVPDVPF